MKNNVVLMCKNTQIIVKTMFLKVVHFACANGKGIKKTSNMRPKSILKSIQNRCENNAQKSDAKMMEN